MAILITNDDGPKAYGLEALRNALVRRKFKTRTITPDHDMSGSGGALSLRNSFRVTRRNPDIYSVDGTAADAAYVGVHGDLWHDIRMVVSGINLGANFGDDLYSSGTLGAAMQGRFLTRLPIAFSLDANNPTPREVEEAAMIAARIVRYFYYGYESDPSAYRRCAMNVNIPKQPIQDIQGVKITCLVEREQPGPVIWSGDWTSGTDALDCFIGKQGGPTGADMGSDMKAVKDGFVSITPVSLDFTHHHGRYELVLNQDDRTIEDFIRGAGE